MLLLAQLILKANTIEKRVLYIAPAIKHVILTLMLAKSSKLSMPLQKLAKLTLV
jgi:hypothetical protein